MHAPWWLWLIPKCPLLHNVSEESELWLCRHGNTVFPWNATANVLFLCLSASRVSLDMALCKHAHLAHQVVGLVLTQLGSFWGMLGSGIAEQLRSCGRVGSWILQHRCSTFLLLKSLHHLQVAKVKPFVPRVSFFCYLYLGFSGHSVPSHPV